MKATDILFQIGRFTAAVIMLQTLFFKFSASAESVYIFSMIGMEPWGRIGVGSAEVVAAGLLLLKRWSWAGALLGIALMAGAVAMHLTILGIEIMGDGGYLFALAVVVLLCSALVLFLQVSSAREFMQRLRSWLNW